MRGTFKMTEVKKLQYELVVEHKSVLYARLFNPNTQTSVIKSYNNDTYVPSIYIPTSNKSAKYKSFTTNEPLVEKTYSNIFDLSAAIKSYRELHTPIYGNTNRNQHYISKNFPIPLESNHNMRTWFLDIETRSINGYALPSNPTEEISMIQVWDSFTETFYILATLACYNVPTSEFGTVKYITYKTEREMMISFVSMVSKLDPTIICGFNSNFYDIPYITNRLDKLKIPKAALSPIGVVTSKETLNPEKIPYEKFEWVGRYLLDYRDLFIKYSYDKLPKYSLESVSNHVLGSGKVKHDEYKSLEDLYLNDFDTFVQYGITDVELLIQIDRKLKFIDTAKLIAYTCGVNVTDVFGTLKQWSSFMYNEAKQYDKILPVSQQYTVDDAIYVGGWTKSEPNKHEWVSSYDFSSLYPSNTRFLNIGVDTLVKENPNREELINFQISKLNYEIEVGEVKIEDVLDKLDILKEALNNDASLNSLGIEQGMPQELKDIRSKYFTYYVPKNLNLIQSDNNGDSELQYFKSLIDNKEFITPVLKKYNVTAAPNGFFYTRNFESVYANLLSRLYADRKIQKKLLAEAEEKRDNGDKSQEVLDAIMYHDLMQGSVLKILLNSSYGSTSLDYNPFSFGRAMSASITTTGRFANRMVAYNGSKKLADINKNKKSMERVPYVVQADTDSCYFNISGIMKLKYPNGVPSIAEGIQTSKNICAKILDPVIQETTDEIGRLLNAYNPSVLAMEQETIADAFISIASKRYFCRYYKKDGEEYLPKYKITGLSLIGKSTPEWCKVKLKPVLGLIADKSSIDIVNYIEEVKAQFTSAKLEDVCVVKGVSGIDYFQEGDKFYKYGNEGRKNPAPFHSRGSIIHNMVLDASNDNTYTRIKAGDKVYILPLTVPNPFYNQNVICFTNPNFINDYKVRQYIDYDTMLVKNFKKNIELITEPIGWSLNPYQGILDDFE